MRVGTRTELKRKWTPQGHRPKAPIHIGYECIHLFVALAPFWGKIFAMFLPRLDQECFALFARAFDESLTQKTMRIVDRATAHKKELMAHTKIELQKLPTACPELNGSGQPSSRALLQRTASANGLQGLQHPTTSPRGGRKSATDLLPYTPPSYSITQFP
jgi:hypothetical protein